MNIMNFLTDEQLDKLPTHRLLALYKKRRRNLKGWYAGLTDYGTYPEVFEDEDNPTVQDYNKFEIYVNKIKTILDNRENVE